MKILIVEDETAAYEIMREILGEIDPSIEVLGNTESVAQTVKWLNTHPAPDLILMDIHLSDGSAFLIFDHITVEVPIIFTTAYDEYAINAFKVNSIDYLLKPLKTSDLERALAKFHRLSSRDLSAFFSKTNKIISPNTYKDKILLTVKDHLLPIGLNEVAYFYTTEKSTTISLKDGTNYPYSKTLDQIYTFLNPSDFYRANKQFIIAKNAVRNITIWFDNRLYITLESDVPERIYISKNKAAEFKEWIVKR